MKTFICLMATALVSAPAYAAHPTTPPPMGTPGYYGIITMDNTLRPRTIYQDPVIAHRARGIPPIYLRVPPGHAKRWAKHCSQYNACTRPVYFVQDDWYNNTYMPYHRTHRDMRDSRSYDDSGRNGNYRGDPRNDGYDR